LFYDSQLALVVVGSRHEAGDADQFHANVVEAERDLVDVLMLAADTEPPVRRPETEIALGHFAGWGP
jgi:hypothetical protein